MIAKGVADQEVATSTANLAGAAKKAKVHCCAHRCDCVAEAHGHGHRGRRCFEQGRKGEEEEETDGTLRCRAALTDSLKVPTVVRSTAKTPRGVKLSESEVR